ncbi:hypothetical protein Slin14017_G087860 [Septoria linicola]|nr:hypothetical protein Slin14017_G087860 [Septoria linicola]
MEAWISPVTLCVNSSTATRLLKQTASESAVRADYTQVESFPARLHSLEGSGSARVEMYMKLRQDTQQTEFGLPLLTTLEKTPTVSGEDATADNSFAQEILQT